MGLPRTNRGIKEREGKELLSKMQIEPDTHLPFPVTVPASFPLCLHLGLSLPSSVPITVPFTGWRRANVLQVGQGSRWDYCQVLQGRARVSKSPSAHGCWGGIQNPAAQRKMSPWSRGKKLESKVWIAAVYTTCFDLSHLSCLSSETIVSTEAGDS